MRMTTMILRLAAAGFCLIAPSLTVSGAPAFLPINSQPCWIIAGVPASVKIVVQTINGTGGLNTCGMSANGISFGSAGDFQSYAANNGSRLFNLLRDRTSTSVSFRVCVTYAGLDPATYMGAPIDAVLGQAGNITANSFRITPSVILPIGGVTNACVQFGNNAGIALPIAGGGIVWNRLFATNSGRIRVSLAFDDGETAIYTQSWSQISPPIVSITQSPVPSLLVTASPGADTVVESAGSVVANGTNTVSWTAVGGISWDSGLTTTTIAAPTNSTGFFRARSF